MTDCSYPIGQSKSHGQANISVVSKYIIAIKVKKKEGQLMGHRSEVYLYQLHEKKKGQLEVGGACRKWTKQNKDKDSEAPIFFSLQCGPQRRRVT